MKPIEDVAKALQSEGWRILWASEVEAIAIRGDGPQNQDIVELFDMLGVKLKKVAELVDKQSLFDSVLLKNLREPQALYMFFPRRLASAL